jgi:CrcB protein
VTLEDKRLCSGAMSATASPQPNPLDPKRRPDAPFAAELGVIALGGAIGAGLRFSVSLMVAAGGLPGLLSVLIANLTGSFVLGLIVGHLESGRPHPLLRPFLTVGVLGSFTTFSALALDSLNLAERAGDLMAVGFLGGSIALGLAAFALGDLISLRGQSERGGTVR